MPDTPPAPPKRHRHPSSRGGNAMSQKPVNALAWAHHEGQRRQYSPTDRVILNTLANHANGARVAWPMVATLAAECCCSERHVQRALRRFEADELIVTERAAGRGNASRYRIRIESQPDLFAAPAAPRKGDSKSPFGPEKVTQSHPLAPEKGDIRRTKKVTQSHPESTKKESTKKGTGLRPENAVAFSPEPPPDFDPRKALWSEGVETLRTLTGQINGQAKKLVGKFLKLGNGDCTAVLGAIRAAKAEGPYEPVPWIIAAIQTRSQPQLSRAERLMRDLGLDEPPVPTIDPEGRAL